MEVSEVKDDTRALYESVWFNRREKMSELIASGVNPAHIYANGRTLLHVAAWFNRADLISPLLEKSPTLLNKMDDSGLTPLDLAIQSGSFPAFKALVLSGSALSSVNSPNGFTAIHRLIRYNRFDFMVWLHDNRKEEVDIDVWFKPDLSGDLPIHTAAKLGYVKIVRWLHSKGSLKTELNAQGFSASDLLKNSK